MLRLDSVHVSELEWRGGGGASCSISGTGGSLLQVHSLEADGPPLWAETPAPGGELNIFLAGLPWTGGGPGGGPGAGHPVLLVVCPGARSHRHRLLWSRAGPLLLIPDSELPQPAPLL